MAVYGIDLGTTYSCVAKLNSTGTPEVIVDNDTAQAIIASAVYLDENGKTYVGDIAKEEAVTNPGRVCQFFKRYIGRTDLIDRQRYVIDGKEYDPIELSAIVLGRIKEYARDSGEDVTDVVITCPAYFSYAQRDATKEAGRIAGFNVMCVVNEPTAAAVNYCANRFDEDKTALVYDLGGGTFDVTLIKMTMQDDSRNVEVLATEGDDLLGGKDWDEKLFQLLMDKYIEQYGGSTDKIPEGLKCELRSKAETVKSKLTLKDSFVLKVAYDGEPIKLTISREEFEKETRQLVDQTFLLLDSVLNKSGYNADNIDIVLLVGGSTKMIMIREAMAGRFGDKVQFSDPDQAVAKGAALVADMKKKGENAKMIAGIQEQIEKGRVSVSVTSEGKIQIVNTETQEVLSEESNELNKFFESSSAAAYEDPDFYMPQTTFIPGQELDSGEFVNIFSSNAAGPGLTVQDVIPRTFGIVVGVRENNGSISLICDNIVQKDEKAPCAFDRTYYTPHDNVERIRLPVIESISPNKADPVFREDESGQLVFPNPDLDMQQRNQLILPVPPGLPAGSEIIVEFSIDDLGNVTLCATEKTSGLTEKVMFNFSNTVSAEQLQQMQEAQDNRKYALDI